MEAKDTLFMILLITCHVKKLDVVIIFHEVLNFGTLVTILAPHMLKFGTALLIIFKPPKWQGHKLHPILSS